MKRIFIFALAVFIFIPIILLAEQAKVYTDSDLENYQYLELKTRLINTTKQIIKTKINKR